MADRTEDVFEQNATLAEHAVVRGFVEETVVLNLQTGQYYGVNPSGGRMLDLLSKGGTLREVAATLAQEYEIPPAEMQQDLLAFCEDLVERGLIILRHQPA